MNQKLSEFLAEKFKEVKRFFILFARVMHGSFLTFNLAKGSEAAAGISYYTLFSMFPLLLCFVAVGSFFVDQSTIETNCSNSCLRYSPSRKTSSSITFNRFSNRAAWCQRFPYWACCGLPHPFFSDHPKYQRCVAFGFSTQFYSYAALVAGDHRCTGTIAHFFVFHTHPYKFVQQFRFEHWLFITKQVSLILFLQPGFTGSDPGLHPIRTLLLGSTDQS